MHRLMELIGERQSLSLSDYITRVVIARKPCGGYSLRLHEGERLKRLKLSADGRQASLPISQYRILYFFLFISVSRITL